jgi:hypothetical protein
MRISGLLALILFLAITAVDGINAVELVVSTLLAVLVALPVPSGK